MNISKAVLGLVVSGMMWAAFSTAPPDAEAANCSNGQSDCSGTCYSPASQRCYSGVLCSNADQYCAGAHGCFNPGTQTCCPTTVVGAGQSCPQAVTPSHSVSSGPQNPQNVPHTSTVWAGNPGMGAPPIYTANVLCPQAPTLNVVRTPIAPAGWTSSGSSAPTHPSKVDETKDRNSNGASPIVTCWYGIGATLTPLTQVVPNTKTCVNADVGDGFFCQ